MTTNNIEYFNSIVLHGHPKPRIKHSWDGWFVEFRGIDYHAGELDKAFDLAGWLVWKFRKIHDFSDICLNA